MAVLAVARVMDGKEQLGLRLVNSDDGRVQSATNDMLKKMSGKAFRNFRVKVDGKIEWVNGSGDRYPCINRDGLLVNGINPLIIVGPCSNGTEMIVCDWLGKMYKEDIKKLIEYGKINGIANGKIVDNSIRAIVGSYKVTTHSEDIQVTKQNNGDIHCKKTEEVVKELSVSKQDIENAIRIGLRDSRYESKYIEPIIGELEDRWVTLGFHKDELLSQDVAEQKVKAQINLLVEYNACIEVHKSGKVESIKEEMNNLRRASMAWGEMMLLGRIIGKKVKNVNGNIVIDETVGDMYDKVKKLAGESWNIFWNMSRVVLLNDGREIFVRESDRNEAMKVLAAYSSVFLA